MIVAVGSDAMEFSGWLRHCAGVRKLDWPVDFARQADWNGQAVTMVANGAGPRLAAEGLAVARDRETVTAVMSIGWCGALDPALRLSEVFVALGVRTEQGDRVLCGAGGKRFGAGGFCAGFQPVSGRERAVSEGSDRDGGLAASGGLDSNGDAGPGRG